MSLGLGLLVGQEKQFEDITLGSWKLLWAFFTIYILWIEQLIEKWNCRIIKSTKKMKVPLKPVAVYGFTHLERFLLFFSPAFLIVPFANVLSDMFQIKSGCAVSRMHLNHNNSLYIGREMFPLLQAQNVQAPWLPAEVFVVCSSAAFWSETWEMLGLDAASSLISVWFVRAINVKVLTF